MTEKSVSDDYEALVSILSDYLDDPAVLAPESSLIGEHKILTSMTLVEVCLALEDLAAEQGFDFDWTSETALSRTRSMFRSVAALAEEFGRQRSVSAGEARP